MDEQLPPAGELTLRIQAMPSDVNVNGDIFGGWVLSQMDIASEIIAGQRAQGRVTTVALDAMKFIRPVRVGDVMCIYGRIARVGRSSMGVLIEAWALRHADGSREKVTEAMFTYVAIDQNGRPRPVPAPKEK